MNIFYWVVHCTCIKIYELCLQISRGYFTNAQCTQRSVLCHGHIASSSKISVFPLQWRHNGLDGVWDHQPHDCLLNRLFRRRLKQNTKALRHWSLCGEFTGDRWIPRTKGQLRGKFSHMMTSSCHLIISARVGWPRTFPITQCVDIL